MIANLQEYRATRRTAARFIAAIRGFEATRPAKLKAGVHPKLIQEERDALEAQLSDLLEDIEDYRRLNGATAGRRGVGRVMALVSRQGVSRSSLDTGLQRNAPRRRQATVRA